jgi:hypothetical protein
MVIPCMFYLKSYKNENRRGKYETICYIVIIALVPIVITIGVLNWKYFIS